MSTIFVKLNKWVGSPSWEEVWLYVLMLIIWIHQFPKRITTRITLFPLTGGKKKKRENKNQENILLVNFKAPHFNVLDHGDKFLHSSPASSLDLHSVPCPAPPTSLYIFLYNHHHFHLWVKGKEILPFILQQALVYFHS